MIMWWLGCVFIEERIEPGSCRYEESLEGQGTLMIDSCDAYTFPAGGSCRTGTDQTVFVEFEAPTAGRWTFDTVGSDYDTVLYVFDGCGGLEETCNDDIAPEANLQSRLGMNLEAGDTVALGVQAFDACGELVLNASREDVTDECLDAAPVVTAFSIHNGSADPDADVTSLLLDVQVSDADRGLSPMFGITLWWDTSPNGFLDVDEAVGVIFEPLVGGDTCSAPLFTASNLLSTELLGQTVGLDFPYNTFVEFQLEVVDAEGLNNPVGHTGWSEVVGICTPYATGIGGTCGEPL